MTLRDSPYSLRGPVQRAELTRHRRRIRELLTEAAALAVESPGALSPPQRAALDACLDALEIVRWVQRP